LRFPLSDPRHIAKMLQNFIAGRNYGLGWGPSLITSHEHVFCPSHEHGSSPVHGSFSLLQL
jgi:hypothetical protein